MEGPWAHSANDKGERDPLVTHLKDTAEKARAFADAFGAGELAYWLGLWHDLGKFHPDWQRYLLAAERWDAAGRAGPKPKGPDHKAAGTRIAAEKLGSCAFAVQGHHGGMTSPGLFQEFLGDAKRVELAEAALRAARSSIPDLAPSGQPALPTFVSREDGEFFVRMLFSALVDADFLDTEEHFRPDRPQLREPPSDLPSLLACLEADEASQAPKRPHTLVNRVRAEVLQACIDSASLEPGFFRLTVPTGGGKTRSSMAFALRHAAAHGLRRVVVAVPFITVANQTADVLDRTFETPVPDDVTREYERTFSTSAVLQHYGGGIAEDGDFRQKLASENWDAPIVVTSTVQLFESLFSNRPSACRKLHRLAKSVIILDEAQALPAPLLEPILDVLRTLVRRYGTTVVFSTATQPAFGAIRGFEALQAREIVADHERHFAELRRVRYTHLSQPQSWEEVAARMISAPAAMTIVNTRAQAAGLYAALQQAAPPGSVFHLSTRMVQRHRLSVLDEVRARLAANEPVYLAATQVVEAGVDISFPLVLRALGPLDAILQAAGRCNRNGELGDVPGEVIVFEPAEAAMPSGPYRTGADLTRGILSREEDLLEPVTQEAYWRDLLRNVTTDGPGIQKLRAELHYPSVAERFRMIEPTASVVVASQDSTGRAREALDLLLERKGGRQEMRALQPCQVSLQKYEYDRLVVQGLIRDVAPGVGEWLGGYGAAGIEVPGSANSS